VDVGADWEFDLEDLKDEKRTEAPTKNGMSFPEGYTSVAGPAWTSLTFKAARKYLEGRGLTRSMCAQLQIGACAGGQYAGRVVLPVFGPAGELEGWFARTYCGADRKYLNASGPWAGSAVFDCAQLEADTDDPLIVVEGGFDALALMPHAVGMLGKNPADDKVSWVASCGRTIVVAFDGDAWQDGLALSLRMRLMGAVAGYVRLPPKTDPAEGITRDEVLDLCWRAAYEAEQETVGG
jgi:DNA primase